MLKSHLRETIAGINACLLSTLGACGDVERNVMACPAPHRHDSVHDQLQETAFTLAALTAENRKYEERFGHVFLIAARGRSADEILRALRRRMTNDPVTELEEAAAEQRKITRMRLLEMLDQ